MLKQQIDSHQQKTFHLGVSPSTQAKNHTGTPTKPTVDIGKTTHNCNLRNNHLTKNNKTNAYKTNPNKYTNAHKTKPTKASPPNKQHHHHSSTQQHQSFNKNSTWLHSRRCHQCFYHPQHHQLRSWRQ